MEWEAGLEPAKTCFADRRLDRFSISHKLAGDLGIEPSNTGFGVRRSPNRACPPCELVGPVGVEPTMQLLLRERDMPFSYGPVSWWGERDSNSHARMRPVLSRVRLPDSAIAPWCRGGASNPQKQHTQCCASAKLRHPGMVWEAGVEPAVFTLWVPRLQRGALAT